MILSAYLPYLKFLVSLYRRSGCTPLDWNEGDKKLSISPVKWRHWAYRINLLVHLAYSISMCLRFLTKSYDFFQTMAGLAYTVIFVGQLVLRWNWDLDSAFVDFVNALIIWEEKG